MSLTKQDLEDIRGIINEAFEVLAIPRFDAIEAQLQEHTAILKQHAALLHEHSSILKDHSNQPRTLNAKVDNIDGRLQAIEADVRELYLLIKAHEHPFIGTKKYIALPDDKKFVVLYCAVQALAKKLHIQLPIA